MDEKLRFVIDLQNKASAELRKLQKDMSGVKKTPGMTQSANWFQQLETASGGATKAIRPLASGLNTIGVSGLAAGLSVAGFIKQMRDLADSTATMKELGRQSGMTATEIARLQYVARNLHVDPSRMTSAISTWSTGMVAFEKRTGAVYSEMQRGSAGLAEKMRAEYAANPAEAYKDQLRWLAAIPEAQMRAGKSAQEAAQIQKYWVGQVLGDEGMEQIFSKGMDGLTEAYAEAAQKVQPITKEMQDQAELLNKSIVDFDASWTHFETSVGPTVFKQLRTAADDFRGTFEQIESAIDRYHDHPEKIGEDAKQAGESIWDHFKKHWQDVGAGKTPLLPNPLDSKSWHFPNPQGGLLDYSKPEDAPAPSGITLPTLLKNFVNSVGSIPGDEYGTTAAGVSSAAAGFRVPGAYNREMRARSGSDGQDHSLDGFVVGSLGKEVIHLTGTLRTASAAINDGNVHQAAFHPTGFGGGALDPQSIITAGTKEGVLAAFREWAGVSAATSRNGIMAASFSGGGGYSSSAAGRGRAPSIRFGRQHSSAPYDDGGATPTGAHDPLKDLIAQHETGGTGASGYDTVYGHAEQPGSKMAALGPPKPITQMSISEILAYQREMKARAHSEAFPVGRAQWVEHTLRGLTRGMDPNTVFTPEVQEKLFDKSIAQRMGQGTSGFRSEWDSLRAVPDGEIDRAMAGHREALKNAAPAVAAGPDGIQGHVRGNLKIGDEAYAYGSGGVHGSAHVPYGDYPIRPDSGNPWGQAHNAMDVNGNGSVWDASLGRMRTGIEMHVAHSANMVTEGCLAFLKDQYPQLKSRVKDMIAKTGHAYLHIDEKGASITPMPKVTPEPQRRPPAGDDGARAQIDPVRIDLHHHESGRTRIAAKAGKGVQISIRTAPTLVQTG